MKNFTFAALAATLAFAATPAMADNSNFTGPRVGLVVGHDDVTGSLDANDVVYGVDTGVDFAVGKNFVLGVEGTVTNPFEDTRTFGVGARAGVAVTNNLMPFARVGWANYKDVFNNTLNGVAVGGGLEWAPNSALYAKVEYRYSDFEQGVGNHGAFVGVGIRF
jgi:outer membrane immunogenic protein